MRYLSMVKIHSLLLLFWFFIFYSLYEIFRIIFFQQFLWQFNLRPFWWGILTLPTDSSRASSAYVLTTTYQCLKTKMFYFSRAPHLPPLLTCCFPYPRYDDLLCEFLPTIIKNTIHIKRSKKKKISFFLTPPSVLLDLFKKQVQRCAYRNLRVI